MDRDELSEALFSGAQEQALFYNACGRSLPDGNQHLGLDPGVLSQKLPSFATHHASLFHINGDHSSFILTTEQTA